jgi:CPA1 family monovalent cation:H+ antiporter
MIITLVLSLLVLALPLLGYHQIVEEAQAFIGAINFTETLMHGMLSFLLFAGALHVQFDQLEKQKAVVASMALFGTSLSTVLVAVVAYYLCPLFGFQLPFIYALIFGALISPTDPVAVMAILRQAGVDKTLETKVVGESLFNDGVAVVLFLTLLGIAVTGNASATQVLGLFVQEVIGGAILGVIAGYGTYLMLRDVDNYKVETLLTLGLVMGSYELATQLHLSGPIAVVIAGLIIGNIGKDRAMSQSTRQHLSNFWELIDELLNVVLFLLIGLEVLVLTFSVSIMEIGLLMIPLLLTIRLICVSLPIMTLKKFGVEFSSNAIRVLTWGGLRGGISVALVLSLPIGEIRSNLLLITYCIVLFSIIVQGLTIAKVARQ